ncbi:ASCH domain-containing protein [Candidatus Nitrospira bockiana]
MKALTLWQPWASLVAFGEKKYETRAWPTTYRGRLAIHAGAHWTVAQRRLCWQSAFARALSRHGVGQPEDLPLGAVLCVVELLDVVETWGHRSQVSEQEKALGNWERGRYAWRLHVVEVFRVPILAKGRQGLWEWSERSV